MFITGTDIGRAAIIPDWLMRDRAITPGAKICYARLLQYAGNRAYAFPKQAQLADELGLGVRQVRNLLKELETADLVKTVTKGTQNVYVLLHTREMGGSAVSSVWIPEFDLTVTEPETTGNIVPVAAVAHSNKEIGCRLSKSVKEMDCRLSQMNKEMDCRNDELELPLAEISPHIRDDNNRIPVNRNTLDSNDTSNPYTGHDCQDANGNSNCSSNCNSNCKANGCSKEQQPPLSLNPLSPPTADSVEEIFEYWRERAKRPRAILNTDRYKKIRQRLKTFSVAELKEAVDGACLNPFFNGQNENGARYNRPETVFKSDSSVESHIDYLHNGGPRGMGRAPAGANTIVTTDAERRAIVGRRL